MADLARGAPRVHRLRVNRIRGVLIRVEDVLDLLAVGATREEILDDDPHQEDEVLAAVLELSVMSLVKLRTASPTD